MRVLNSRVCPLCQRLGRLLPASSAEAVVEFYRCGPCNVVWLCDTRHPDAAPKVLIRPEA